MLDSIIIIYSVIFVRALPSLRMSFQMIYMNFMRNVMNPQTIQHRYKVIRVEDYSRQIENSLSELDNISDFLGRTSRQLRQTIRNFEETYKGKEKNDFLNMAVDIAYYHHENWNGTGYPRQLNGIEIPLSARIVRVIDVFDSMLSERAYRKAYPLEEVLKFIENGAGANFDPVIVEIFLKIYRNFKIGRDSDK